MNVDEMSRRFDLLEQGKDDMMELIMRTSEIQSRPKKHDKMLEILEHQITDLQEKLDTCNEDKAKIEQDKLKAEALAKRMFDSYDKLSKKKEKDAVLMVAEKMDSVAPPKALTVASYMSTSKPSSADNFLSIRDGQHLVHVPRSEQILTTKTIYLKQERSPPGFKKIGTLIDQQTDRTGKSEKTYYYFSENPKQEYSSTSFSNIFSNMFYDPIEGNERRIYTILQPIIDAEINKSVECIKSCGLKMSFSNPGYVDPYLGADYNFKIIFYNYLKGVVDGYKIVSEKFVKKDIEKERDNLIRLYESLSLENYNKLIATPGVNNYNMNVTCPIANEVTTAYLVKILEDAKFPDKLPHMVQRYGGLKEQLGLWHPYNSCTRMPEYSMFEKAQHFIKCKIDFIEKIMMIEREITEQISEKTVKKSGVGLGLKTKRKYTKHRKSHKRKQRRQHKKTK
jgi:hypothetical protein